MARGIRLVLKVNVGTVLQSLRVRSQRRVELVNAATERLAGMVNAPGGILEQVYPVRVAQTVRAEADLARAGGHLYALRLRRINVNRYGGNLWQWYEYGVRDEGAQDGPTREYGNPILSFYWPLVGEQVWFLSVHHRGYPGRHRLPELAARVTDACRTEWTAALAEALIKPVL